MTSPRNDAASTSLSERQMQPNVGGGVDRDKLSDSDFVFADERKFPVVTKGDVSDAVSSWGRYQGPHSFEDFKKRLTALAKRKGFEDALPADWKESAAPTVPTQAVAFAEALDLQGATLDSANRTVRQVLIKAGMSANRRLYTETTLQAAAPKFEGTRTYANHPSKSELKDRPERNVRELTGWVTDVKYESGALVGTRHFARTQAGNDSWALVEDIVNGKAPKTLMGASINAVGKARTDKDTSGEFTAIESIESVYSVDDVTTPAAGGGFDRLIASAGDITTELLSAMDFEQWYESRPEFVERLKKEWKTVRLEEETKRALAESDQKVKAAETKAEDATETITRLQAELETLRQERDAAVSEAQSKARELALEKALREAALPPVYEVDLRERLLKESPEAWPPIITREKQKAQKAAPPRIAIPNAGQTVVPTPIVENRPPQSLEADTSWTSDPARLAEVLKTM